MNFRRVKKKKKKNLARWLHFEQGDHCVRFIFEGTVPLMPRCWLLHSLFFLWLMSSLPNSISYVHRDGGVGSFLKIWSLFIDFRFCFYMYSFICHFHRFENFPRLQECLLRKFCSSGFWSETGKRLFGQGSVKTVLEQGLWLDVDGSAGGLGSTYGLLAFSNKWERRFCVV